MHPNILRDYTFVVAFLALSFYVEFVVNLSVFLVSLLLSLIFVRWRKEVYLLWSVVEPRVTGGLNFTKRILDIAREEGI